MVKKIIVIVIGIILLISEGCIKASYNYDSTKVKLENTYTYEDLVEKYVNYVFDNIINKNYEGIYNTFEAGVFKDINEFKEISNKNFTDEGNLVTSEVVGNLEKNVYEVKVRVEPPLFSSYEELKLEQYKEKYFSLKVKKNGLFDYKILEFKKV